VQQLASNLAHSSNETMEKCIHIYICTCRYIFGLLNSPFILLLLLCTIVGVCTIAWGVKVASSSRIAIKIVFGLRWKNYFTHCFIKATLFSSKVSFVGEWTKGAKKLKITSNGFFYFFLFFIKIMILELQT
jgi:hypothetical protein